MMDYILAWAHRLGWLRRLLRKPAEPETTIIVVVVLASRR